MVETAAPSERQIEEHASARRARREAYEVRGKKIVGRIKELVREGNVRHAVTKNEEAE